MAISRTIHIKAGRTRLRVGLLKTQDDQILDKLLLREGPKTGQALRAARRFASRLHDLTNYKVIDHTTE